MPLPNFWNTEGERHSRARLRAEVLGLRVEASFLRFVLLHRKFNPAQPRIPARSLGGGQWTDGGGSIGDGELVLVGGGSRRSGPPTVRIGGRDIEGTPGQAARFEVIRAQAAAAETAVREIDPKWRAPAGLYETIEGGIRREEARLMAANARLMELGNPVIRSESFNVCMTRDGRSLSWREGRAGEDVETVSKSDLSHDPRTADAEYGRNVSTVELSGSPVSSNGWNGGRSPKQCRKRSDRRCVS